MAREQARDARRVSAAPAALRSDAEVLDERARGFDARDVARAVVVVDEAEIERRVPEAPRARRAGGRTRRRRAPAAPAGGGNRCAGGAPHAGRWRSPPGSPCREASR